ncbi:unnamed protein product [Parnassius mnemosyne]|uniref:RNA-directed DNA polymerase n=1 Tax=Parnassius mnemosyne TaxID=213953 RepID=A0AAV1LTB4_9NEOP
MSIGKAAERDSAAVEQAGDGDGLGGSGADSALHAVTSSTSRARTREQDSAPRAFKGREHGGGNALYCSACGSRYHRSDDCRYKKFVCGKCKQSGHLRRVCPKRGGYTGNAGSRRHMYHVEAAECETPSADDEPPSVESQTELQEDLHHLCLNSYKPVSLTLLLDGFKLNMEIDTGSAVSCISKATYNKYFYTRPMDKFDLVLKFYDGSRIKPLGIIKPEVRYGNITKHLELFVIDGGTTSLLGRQWLSELQIKIPTFHSMVLDDHFSNNNLSLLLDRYNKLFSGGLGRFAGGKATLRVREGATPVFCRARPLPYALKDRVDAELDAMLREGVIEPVESSDWATPLVPVRKADGGLRICADYKVTLNPVLLVDRFPLPRINDLLVGMNGAKIFSKIDLSQAYNQIELDNSKNLTVINTHRGLFTYNRLVYGLSSSPGIFQRIMSNLFHDIEKVEVFLDDLIIGSSNEREHLQILETVLSRLHKNGMKLRKDKCLFMVDEVKYLGYIISKDGIKVDPDKVAAIVKIPRPKDVSDLRSFLGLVNFYAKFIKNLSTTLAPLYGLLKKGVTWDWDRSCEDSFKKIKKVLTSAEVLLHYDQNKPLILTCDASARGIGGVLTQPCAGAAGSERPVVYVSRALSDAEKHYSQIDREALAIVFCLKKLHQYLYGRRFTLRTDHKPLVSIFGPKHGIPLMAASRLQRWAITVSAYSYDIEYVSSKQNCADGLSRLPVSVQSTKKECLDLPEQTYLHFAQSEMLLDYNEIKKQTQRDPILGRIILYLREDWPIDNVVKSLQPYFNRKKELYEELGCIMWGHRVVIPENCRGRVLNELHECHMGIVKTKAVARSYVWWPGIDEAIETMCRACVVCAAEADAPQRHTPSPWPWPAKPWSRIHIDFLGPIFNKIYLVIIDARTKWLEVFYVPSTAASHTIVKLSEVFARWGLPKQLVSDNGPPFISKEFSQFLTNNGIQHVFTAPYHPASNGAAENAVRTVKKVIKKAVRENKDINLFLNTFLLHYQNTEHCTTGESPASLMLGRRLRTKLDVLRPDIENKIIKTQINQKENAPTGERGLQPGEDVWLRRYQGSDKWTAGQVTQRLGVTDYKVLDTIGKESHKHIDQLKRRIRSSLICPRSSNSQPNSSSESLSCTGAEEINAPRINPAVKDTGRKSKAPEGTEIIDKSDCLDTARETSTLRAPSAHTSPVPPATPPQVFRPVRKCRLDNPPSYKE